MGLADEDLEDPIFRSLRPSSPSGTVKPTQPTGSKPSTTTARSAFRTAHRLPTSSPSTAVQAQAGQGKSSIRAANAHAGGTAARALPKSNSVRFAAPVAPAAPVASAASRPAVASASAPTATSRARLAQGTTSSATSAAAPRRIAKPGLPTDALARKPAVPAAPLRGNTARDTIITARAGTSTGTASTRVSFQDRPRTRTQTQIRAQARSTSTGKADAVAGAKQVDDSAIWARQEILDDLGADGEADGEGLMLCLDSDPDEA